MAILINLSCNKEEKNPPQPMPGSVVIVCDDWNVDNWYTYADSFDKYEMKLTFYVSHFHQMTSEKVAKLIDLQSRGHEIAYHTLNHIFWDTSFSQEEIDDYLRVEIDSGLGLFIKAGFVVNSFAFPGEMFDSTIFQLVSKRFKYMRSGHFAYFEYWLRRQQYKLSVDENQEFWSYAVDNGALFDTDGTMDMMIDDIKAGNNIALLIHSWTYEPIIYTTRPDDFFAFVRKMHEAGITFKTVSNFYN